MAADYTLPLTPSQNQSYAININGTLYNLAFLFVDATDAEGDQNVGWTLDISDVNQDPIVLGIPLVTGINLVAQYAYLGLNFAMFCFTKGNPSAPPVWSNLGGQAQVVVEF